MDVNVNSVEPVIPTADDYAADVAATQAALRKVAERMGAKGDEARAFLLAMSDTIGTLAKTTLRWEQATADIIASRETYGEAERARLIRDTITANQETFTVEIRKRAERMIRGWDRGTSVRIGSHIGGAFVGGLLIGALTVAIAFWASGSGPWSENAAWAELARYNPDPRPALTSAGDRTASDGRHYRIIALWTDPPKPAPSK